jgi:hypothetical protein
MSPKVLSNNSGRFLQTKSSRALKLYKIKKEARKIRELHSNGEITAAEAAKQLRALHSVGAYMPRANPFIKVSA